MRYSKVRDVASPSRGHGDDAGIDFYVPNDFTPMDLEPNERVNIPSGIKVDIPSGYALIAFNKSGVATKHGLIAGACVIDSGYQGEIHLNMINTSDDYVEILPGMKILQFILLRVGLKPWKEVPEESLHSHLSGRGEGGFGSTGCFDKVS